MEQHFLFPQSYTRSKPGSADRELCQGLGGAGEKELELSGLL